MDDADEPVAQPKPNEDSTVNDHQLALLLQQEEMTKLNERRRHRLNSHSTSLQSQMVASLLEDVDTASSSSLSRTGNSSSRNRNNNSNRGQDRLLDFALGEADLFSAHFTPEQLDSVRCGLPVSDAGCRFKSSFPLFHQGASKRPRHGSGRFGAVGPASEQPADATEKPSCLLNQHASTADAHGGRLWLE